MYPDLKFMNLSDNDIIFAPLENMDINNGLFIPEEFIEEFRTSSVSNNPLKFDFRETLLNANIDNNDEELKELIASYESDSNILRDNLESYNSNLDYSFENSTPVPLASDILRELDLDINEEVLQLNKDFEESYTLESRYPNKCNPNIIFNNILNSNPRIMNVLSAYNIPFPVSKKIIMQIINGTLTQCNNNQSNNWFPKPGYNVPTFYGTPKIGDSNDVQ